jgi:hypothetical protein
VSAAGRASPRPRRRVFRRTQPAGEGRKQAATAWARRLLKRRGERRAHAPHPLSPPPRRARRRTPRQPRPPRLRPRHARPRGRAARRAGDPARARPSPPGRRVRGPRPAGGARSGRRRRPRTHRRGAPVAGSGRPAPVAARARAQRRRLARWRAPRAAADRPDRGREGPRGLRAGPHPRRRPGLRRRRAGRGDAVLREPVEGPAGGDLRLPAPARRGRHRHAVPDRQPRRPLRGPAPRGGEAGLRGGEAGGTDRGAHRAGAAEPVHAVRRERAARRDGRGGAAVRARRPVRRRALPVPLPDHRRPPLRARHAGARRAGRGGRPTPTACRTPRG